MGRLTAIQVRHAKPGRHADGDGLYLLVKDSGSRSWVLRVQVAGRRRDIGLGSGKHVLLADARLKAAKARAQLVGGLDPATEKKKAQAVVPSFAEAARACHADLAPGWRNPRHRASWLVSLEQHIIPEIGSTRVDAVTSADVRDALVPIWLTIPETARRILQRVGVVLGFAHIKGWRPDEPSLRSVPKGLPRQPKTENHFAAMAFSDAPEFMAKLTAKDATAGRDALRFTILCAVRSNETRFATWPEFDLEKGLWTIPGSRMKAKATHIVPLSGAALSILRRRWGVRWGDDGLVFSTDGRRPLSDMTMTAALRDEGETCTTHGFRSSFTDWAAETTDFPKEVVDKALAHKIPDRVEAAYRRTDFLNRRRQLMREWAEYLEPKEATSLRLVG